ncbi:MAG: VOC family protein, partial [Inhella sp.]
MPSERFDHLFIEPSSYEATVAFYKDKLGWTELFSWGSAGQPKGIGLSGGAISIVIAERHPTEDHSKSHGINGNRPTVHLKVKDLDARYAELQASGLPLFAPEETHWGTRWFVVQDP